MLETSLKSSYTSDQARLNCQIDMSQSSTDTDTDTDTTQVPVISPQETDQRQNISICKTGRIHIIAKEANCILFFTTVTAAEIALQTRV